MSDLVIKGATILDPSTGINEKKDLSVSRGKIEEVSNSISEGSALKVIDASGMILTPGFVDIHTHVANKVIGLCIDPSENCLMKGTTTVADAGSCGELNFDPFKEYVIKKSKARILAFLNIESLGMIEFIDSSGQKWAELLNSPESSIMFADAGHTTKLIRENRLNIVGIKWAHHTLNLLELARKAADEVPCKVMAEARLLPTSLKYLKSGDITTHIFHNATHRVTMKHDGMTEDGKTIPSRSLLCEKERRDI